MVEKNGVIFNKKAFATGGSLALTVPPELATFLQVEEGTEVQLSAYDGKKGKFIAVWKKKTK